MANEVFISYSRSDYQKVRKIKETIDRVVGIECWMDIEDIESDQQFVDVIINAINKHDTVLFMMSRFSMQSKWALDELAFAEKKNKRIVLVSLDKADMPDNFYFLYHGKDQIDWDNELQRNKFIKNLRDWFPSQSQGGDNRADNTEIKISPRTTDLYSSTQKESEYEIDNYFRRIQDIRGLWGFCSPDYKILIKCQWADVGNFSEGLARVKNDEGKWGFINRDGTLVFPCLWEDAGDFSEGLAKVAIKNNKNNILWGFINLQGKAEIICSIPAKPTDFHHDEASYMLGNNYEVTINKKGLIIKGRPLLDPTISK